MRVGDVPIVVSLPKAYRNADVFEAKAPVVCEEGKVLRSSQRTGRGGTSIVFSERTFHKWTVQYLEIRCWKLTRGGSQRQLGPAAEDGSAKGERWIDQVHG